MSGPHLGRFHKVHIALGTTGTNWCLRPWANHTGLRSWTTISTIWTKTLSLTDVPVARKLTPGCWFLRWSIIVLCPRLQNPYSVWNSIAYLKYIFSHFTLDPKVLNPKLSSPLPKLSWHRRKAEGAHRRRPVKFLQSFSPEELIFLPQLTHVAIKSCLNVFQHSGLM